MLTIDSLNRKATQKSGLRAGFASSGALRHVKKLDIQVDFML